MTSQFPHLDERLDAAAHPPAPRPGDLLFGNRPCHVQALMNLTADPWTHIAIVVGADDDPTGTHTARDDLRTVELGPRGLMSRPVDEFIDRYRLFGLARPDMGEGCRQAFTTAAALELRLGHQEYSWSLCTVTGSTGLLRRLAPARMEPRVIQAGLQTMAAIRRSRPSGAATCSSMVADLLQAACPSCRPSTGWPARPRVAPWSKGPSAADLVGLDVMGSSSTSVDSSAADRHPTEGPSDRTASARVMLTPSDLWVASRYRLRTIRDGRRTTILAPEANRFAPEHSVDRACTHTHRPSTGPAPTGTREPALQTVDGGR